ncbi:MAG: hypothetical protein IPK23_14775 [Rhizobiales bacterium]|nr:hypothetical protein [Hyphomicrobiales bacterium]
MTALKAALNLAYQHGLVPSDHAWRRVKRFPHTDAPRIRWLSKEHIRALDAALESPFKELAERSLLERYSELCNSDVMTSKPHRERYNSAEQSMGSNAQFI